MTKSFNRKALGAFKKLGVVALITATLATCLTACNQTGGGGGKPKHAITFSVDSTTPNGTLKAKADGVPETEASPITVEEGKTVTFTAKANDGYRVKGWTLDNNAITEAGKSNTYTHTVTKPATIIVSFEEIPKHKITFKVEGTNGWFKAMVGEVEITSGREIEEGKVITFTATPDATYRVKEWKVDDASIEGNKTNTYTHTVTKSANITVSFEKIPKHKITFSVDGANGTLTAKVDGGKIVTGEEVVEGKTVTFTAKADAGYGVKEWKVDDTAFQDNKENTYTHTVTQPATIKVSFELLPPGEAILTLSPDKRYIEVSVGTIGYSDITVEGCTETTLKGNYTPTTLYANGTTIILKGYITGLYCKGKYNNRQSLTALNVQGCTTLRKLECKYTQLTELNVSGLTALQELNCESNLLTELNVQGCVALQELNCSSWNQLTKLDVSGLTALQKLNCSYNKLTALNVQGCTALKELICSRNQLTELNVQGCTALKELYCYQNKLNADAFTKFFNDLPERKASDSTRAVLYEDKDEDEGNCKDFTTDENLKTAFYKAKYEKHWKMYKWSNFNYKEI